MLFALPLLLLSCFSQAAEQPGKSFFLPIESDLIKKSISIHDHKASADPEFCRKTNLFGRMESTYANFQHDNYGYSAILPNIEALFESDLKLTRYELNLDYRRYKDWEAFSIPSFNLKRHEAELLLSYFEYNAWPFYADNLSNSVKPFTQQKAIEAFSQSGETLKQWPVNTESVQAYFTNRGYYAAKGDFERFPRFFKWLICKSFAPDQTADCEKGLQLMNDFMKRGPCDLVAVPLIVRVLDHPELYLEPVKRAAVKILNHVEKLNLLPGDTLLKDLQDEFIKEGLDKKVAFRRAVDVIGLYAIKGPRCDCYNAAMTEKNRTLIIAIQTIALYTQVIDSITSTKFGYLYTYPSEVQGQCDSGKPYRYWLAFVMAREFVQKGLKPQVAAILPFIGDFGYNLYSSESNYTLERHMSTRKFTSWFEGNSFSAHNNKTRLDLVYDLAGGYQGAISAGQSSINKSVPILKWVDQMIYESAIDNPYHPSSEDFRKLGAVEKVIAINRFIEIFPVFNFKDKIIATLSW